MKILLTEDQFKSTAIPFFQEKDMEISVVESFKRNWELLTEDEKDLTIELYNLLYPKRSQKLKEGMMDWAQTGLDVVGIFDPTGIADLTNAVLYFGRGEPLFGMLSLVSLVPYAGDAIAKPIILGGKALGAQFKVFRTAVLAKDAQKMAMAANSMKNSGSVGRKVFEFLDGFNKGMGDKIKKILQKGKNIPIVGKFARTIDGWIDLFKRAGKQINVPTKVGTGSVTRIKGLGGATVKITHPEKVSFLNTLKQMMNFKGSPTVFREMAKKGKFKLLGKEFKKIWQVPQHRKLLGRTKLYLRFLDSVGMANFVGPDELIEELPNAESKLEAFMNSPEGQTAFNEEFINSSEISSSTASDITSDSKEISSGQYEKLLSSFGLDSSKISEETKNVLLQYLKSLT